VRKAACIDLRNFVTTLMVYFRIIIEQTKKVYCNHSQIGNRLKMYEARQLTDAN